MFIIPSQSAEIIKRFDQIGESELSYADRQWLIQEITRFGDARYAEGLASRQPCPHSLSIRGCTWCEMRDAIARQGYEQGVRDAAKIAEHHAMQIARPITMEQKVADHFARRIMEKILALLDPTKENR